MTFLFKIRWTDNGRDGFDYFGSGSWDDVPDDEVNRMTEIGEHFGYPSCHSLGTGSPYLRDSGPALNILDDVWGNLSDFSCNETDYSPAVCY